MKKGKLQLKALFEELDAKMDAINRHRVKEGAMILPRAEVILLGQMSLLANDEISMVLTLAQTADLDALLKMDSVLKDELKALLKKHGLVYDEDSHLIWIPRGAVFESLFELRNVTIKAIDPESALVSKAVKAPKKNRQLIREALVCGRFPGLIGRIEKSGGNLEFFAED